MRGPREYGEGQLDGMRAAARRRVVGMTVNVYGEGYYRYRESTLDFRVEARLIGRLLRVFPGCRVLEVGCGGGALMRSLSALGCQVVGVDIAEEAVRLAEREAKGCRVLRADASRLPFDDHSFDRVVAHHLVEHLEEPESALREWARVLSEDGILVICTPNRRYPSPRIFDDPTHVHLYDREELSRLVESSGFRILESFTVFPHLLRDRVSVKVGVPLHFLFRRLPVFSERGRSLLLSARKLPPGGPGGLSLGVRAEGFRVASVSQASELSPGGREEDREAGGRGRYREADRPGDALGDQGEGLPMEGGGSSGRGVAPRPKVLVVNHAVELGGAERVLLRLTDHLLARGFELGLACPAEGPLVAEMRKRGVRVHLGHPRPRLLRIRRKSLGGGVGVLLYPWDLAMTVLRLASLLRREGYQVVLTNSVKADIYGGLAARLAGRPVAWRFHDIPDRQAFGRLNLFLVRFFSRRFADRVLPVSEASRRAFLQLGTPGERLRTVYNGLDPEGEASPADPLRVREGLGVPADAPLAVWVGRVVDWKGPDRFVEAAALVSGRIPEARFLVVGDALFGDRGYLEGLQEEVRRRGLEDRLAFTGFRDDAWDIMAASDLLVHSSLLPDPLPTVILEAMALGKPVVAFRGGGVDEMVIPGETGLLVEPGDTQGLARAMERLLSRPEEAAEMGRMGALRFRELFSVDSTYRVIGDELESLASGGSRRCKRGAREGCFSDPPMAREGGAREETRGDSR